MKNNLIIAAAGSGKTTFIVNESLKIKDKRVLITTFTEANEQEIRKKFVEINGYIPENITIKTWFSFLIKHGVKPYQDYICECEVKGLQLVNQKSGLIGYGRNRQPYYYSEHKNPMEYYFNKSSQIYSDKISKFVVNVNYKSDGLVIDRLSRIFQYVFIDEVQDLAGYDLEIVKILTESTINVTLVGDPRQVTYHTHEESKYSKYQDGRIKDFILTECDSKSINIDEDSLNVTYRNYRDICLFSNNLFPNMKPCGYVDQEEKDEKGVFFVDTKSINSFLSKYNAIQLRYDSRKKVNEQYSVMNMGLSKGLTFENVLIYPTQDMEKWLFDNNQALSNAVRAKFYVAITRARNTVGIVISKKKYNTPRGVKNYE